MAAPNLIGATTINGKTAGANLTTTSVTTVLNNPASSGKCLKINTLNVNNYNSSTTSVAVTYWSQANSSGTPHMIAGILSIPGNSTLNVIDKSSQYYLEENSSISATSNTANSLSVTVSYEDIS